MQLSAVAIDADDHQEGCNNQDSRVRRAGQPEAQERQGILMEKLGIDADQAFAYLRRISQNENRKLIMICQEIVNTRQLSQ